MILRMSVEYPCGLKVKSFSLFPYEVNIPIRICPLHGKGCKHAK